MIAEHPPAKDFEIDTGEFYGIRNISHGACRKPTGGWDDITSSDSSDDDERSTVSRRSSSSAIPLPTPTPSPVPSPLPVPSPFSSVSDNLVQKALEVEKYLNSKINEVDDDAVQLANYFFSHMKNRVF